MNNQIKIEREYDVSVSDLYSAWSNPEELKKWFAPEGMTTPFADVDLREGGSYRIAMGEADKQHIAVGKYTEVIPEKKLTFTWKWEGGDEDTVVTVEFEKVSDEKTKMIFTHTDFNTEQSAKEHEKGWISTFNKLKTHIV